MFSLKRDKVILTGYVIYKIRRDRANIPFSADPSSLNKLLAPFPGQPGFDLQVAG